MPQGVLTKHFQNLMNGVHGKFDVVFTEIFGSDCWAVVAHKMKVSISRSRTKGTLSGS